MEFIQSEEAKILKEMYKNEYKSKLSKKISAIYNKGKEFYEKALKDTKESFKNENNDVKSFNRTIIELAMKLAYTLEFYLYNSIQDSKDITFDILDQFVTKIIFDSFCFQNKEDVVKQDKLNNDISFDLFDLEKYSIDASENKIKETIYNIKQSFINKRTLQIKKKVAPLVAYYKVHLSKKNEYSVLNSIEEEDPIEKLFKDNDNLLEVLDLIQEKINEKLNEMELRTANINSIDLESEMNSIKKLLDKFNLQNKFDKKIDLGKFYFIFFISSENPYFKNEIDTKIDLKNKLITIEELFKEICYYISIKDIKNNDLKEVTSKMENYLSETRNKVNNYIKIKELNKNKITNTNELINETLKKCQSYQSFRNLQKIKYENLNDLLLKIASNNNILKRGQSNIQADSSFNNFYIKHILQENKKALDYDDLPLKNIVFSIVNIIFLEKYQLDYSDSLNQFNEKLEYISELKSKINENVISDLELKLKEKIIQNISYKQNS